MKKFLVLISSLAILSSCADVEGFENDISTLEEEVQQLTTDIVSIENEKEKLEEEITTLISENNKLQKDYDKYKKKMSPYKELEEAETKAKIAEAKRVVAEEKEAAEKKKAEEEAAKKAKQEAAEKKKAEEEAVKKAKEVEEIAKGYETGITYQELARTPDDYMGEKIKFSGKVIQLIEGTDEIQLRFAVNDDYDQMLYLAYSPNIVEQRVLEDDYLTIYGTSFGTISYESTLGGNITIPAALVDKIDFN